MVMKQSVFSFDAEIKKTKKALKSELAQEQELIKSIILKNRQDYCSKHNIDFDKLIERMKLAIANKQLDKTEIFYKYDFNKEYRISYNDYSKTYGLYICKITDSQKVYNFLIENPSNVKGVLDLHIHAGAIKNLKRIIEENPVITAGELIKITRVEHYINAYLNVANTNTKEELIQIYKDIKMFNYLADNGMIDVASREYYFIRKSKPRANELTPKCFEGGCLDFIIEQQTIVLSEKELTETEKQMKNILFSRESF